MRPEARATLIRSRLAAIAQRDSNQAARICTTHADGVALARLVSLGFVRRVTPTGDALLTQTYLAIHEAYSALKATEEPMINTPCRFYQLVAEWSFFETGAGTGEPIDTCNNPPTAYVELGGQRAGTLLGRVCQEHGDKLMCHPGYRSIQALREPAGKHTNSGGCDD